MTTDAPAEPTQLALTGDLTINYAGEVKAQLLAALEAGGPTVVSLAEVSELDTAGLQLLLLARREAELAGQPWQVVDVPSAVLEVLAIAGLDLTAVGGTP